MSLRRAAFPVLLSLLSAPAALAATGPTIKAATPGVQVGHEGAWKQAAPGMTISELDFVKVPEKATVTIVLPNAATKDFAGRTIIPGRRLASDKVSAGAMVYFAQGLQKAAAAVVGDSPAMGKSNGATKAGTPTPRIAYTGETDEIDRTLRHASAAIATGNFEEAESLGNKALSNKAIDRTLRVRANLVLGEAEAGEGNYKSASSHLDVAAADTSEDPSTRVEALLTRGQVWMQLADDAKAKADFDKVLDLASPGSADVSKAKYYLGVLAVGANDTETAKKYFAELKDSPALYQAGQSMLNAK